MKCKQIVLRFNCHNKFPFQYSGKDQLFTNTLSVLML